MKGVFGREGKDYYIPYYAKFLDKDVRVILINRKRYIVVRDMFKALGRLKSNGSIHSDDKGNLLELLDNLNEGDKYLENIKIHAKVCEGRNSTSTSKAREMQKVNLLNIEVLPIVLTQYSPTKKSKDYENKLEIWSKFMRFVNSILMDYKLEDYIIEDKENWKEETKVLESIGLSAEIVNRHVNINIVKLLGVYSQGIKEIKKEELKIYESQTTMDLLAIRHELYHDYIELYKMFNSKEMARKGSLNKAIDKYKVKIDKESIK